MLLLIVSYNHSVFGVLTPMTNEGTPTWAGRFRFTGFDQHAGLRKSSSRHNHKHDKGG
jgi:hypothetical protein